MKVLFVDDEIQVLRGLERLLFDWDAEIDATFVPSGADALKCLANEQFDVLITDMRMPGMDGAALLAQVVERHPQVIRIILSGQADEATSSAAADYAHQFLSKPLEADLLAELLTHLAKLRRLLSDDSLRAALSALHGLPSPPRVYLELDRVLKGPSFTADQVVALVETDAGLTSRLLQLVNSSFFARRHPTTDIRSAVVHLGVRAIRQAILCGEVFGVNSAVGDLLGPLLEEMQMRALRTAKLAEFIGVGSRFARDAFVMGLLADVGQLALVSTRGSEWLDCLRESRRDGTVLEELELSRLGVAHPQAGAFLLGIWGVPFQIVEAVASHHRPESNPLPYLTPPAIAAISTALLEGRTLVPEYLNRLGVSERLGEWEMRAQQLREGQP